MEGTKGTRGTMGEYNGIKLVSPPAFLQVLRQDERE